MGKAFSNPVAPTISINYLRRKRVVGHKKDTTFERKGLQNAGRKKSIQRLQRAIGKSGAGREEKLADGKRRQYAGLSFHSLRHTTTSMLKNTGISSAIAGDVVGHYSEAMQRNYTKIDMEAKRQALDKLPDLIG